MEKDPAAASAPQAVTPSPAEPIVAPGMHLLLDFWGCRHLRDLAGIGDILRKAAAACGAKVLDVQLHSFGDTAGVTGVAILAESHISIHTWPETDYIALDVFVCGHCDANKAADVLVEYFAPERQNIAAHRRGVAPQQAKQA